MALDFMSPSHACSGQSISRSQSLLSVDRALNASQTEEFEVHGPRLTRYAIGSGLLLAGHHWAYRRPPGEPQVTANYVAAMS